MPDLIEKRLSEQMDYARIHYTWKTHAKEWERML